MMTYYKCGNSKIIEQSFVHIVRIDKYRYNLALEIGTRTTLDNDKIKSITNERKPRIRKPRNKHKKPLPK